MCSIFIYLITLNVLFILSMLLKLIVFKLGRMEHLYLMLEEEYDKDHQARYIEAGQVTKIVKFFTLTLVREVCKTNKHCFMSFLGYFDPPSQGPR
jgi:hypothetical protein